MIVQTWHWMEAYIALRYSKRLSHTSVYAKVCALHSYASLVPACL